MRTFVQKQKVTQQTTYTMFANSSRTHFGQNRKMTSILHLQGTVGNQALMRLIQCDTARGFADDSSRIPVHAIASINVQPTIEVNVPGDIYEQEANRVSLEVLRMPDPHVQRTCACDGECPKNQAEQLGPERERFQTKRIQSNGTGQIVAPPIV